jgi:hypothetical protein
VTIRAFLVTHPREGKNSCLRLNECIGLYAPVEVSVAEFYVWHRVLEW